MVQITYYFITVKKKNEIYMFKFIFEKKDKIIYYYKVNKNNLK